MFLVYSHYGTTSYLEPILKWNRSLWGDKVIFIGDAHNKSVVEKCGWRFFDMDKAPVSSKRSQFLDHYQDISGKDHANYKNGRNWLRYVFERWFLIEEVMTAIGDTEFIHFDSDVLITSKAGIFSIAEKLRYTGKVTSQCNDGCMNGYINQQVLMQFTSSIINQFKDHRLLHQYLEEFEVNVGYAFTEMRAFDNFQREKSVSQHALTLDGWILDDCLAQSQDFVTEILLNGREVKKVFFRDGHTSFQKITGELVPVAALNFSWLETSYIRYAQDLISQNSSKNGLRRFRDIVYLPKFVKRRCI